MNQKLLLQFSHRMVPQVDRGLSHLQMLKISNHRKQLHLQVLIIQSIKLVEAALKKMDSKEVAEKICLVLINHASLRLLEDQFTASGTHLY